jgi:hypothetical protein
VVSNVTLAWGGGGGGPEGVYLSVKFGVKLSEMAFPRAIFESRVSEFLSFYLNSQNI